MVGTKKATVEVAKIVVERKVAIQEAIKAKQEEQDKIMKENLDERVVNPWDRAITPAAVPQPPPLGAPITPPGEPPSEVMTTSAEEPWMAPPSPSINASAPWCSTVHDAPPGVSVASTFGAAPPSSILTSSLTFPTVAFPAPPHAHSVSRADSVLQLDSRDEQAWAQASIRPSHPHLHASDAQVPTPPSYPPLHELPRQLPIPISRPPAQRAMGAVNKPIPPTCPHGSGAFHTSTPKPSPPHRLGTGAHAACASVSSDSVGASTASAIMRSTSHGCTHDLAAPTSFG
ncbi:MAG: hypothetical protein WDW36_006804 [Sanguina aurantia]